MTANLNVLGLSGSLRKGSFNAALLRALPELAPASMTISMAPPIGDIPLYNADIQNQDGFPDPVVALGDAIRAADALILVTPEYNFSVPGVLKNAIDWLSRLPEQPFARKPVALQSAATGMLGGARAQYHLRQILVPLEADLFNKPEIMVNFAKSKFDDELRLTDQPTRDIIGKQLAGFAAYIERVRG